MSPISYCPYCGDESLFPVPDAEVQEQDAASAWYCRSCTRTFTVRRLTTKSHSEG